MYKLINKNNPEKRCFEFETIEMELEYRELVINEENREYVYYIVPKDAILK